MSSHKRESSSEPTKSKQAEEPPAKKSKEEKPKEEEEKPKEEKPKEEEEEEEKSKAEETKSKVEEEKSKAEEDKPEEELGSLNMEENETAILISDVRSLDEKQVETLSEKTPEDQDVKQNGQVSRPIKTHKKTQNFYTFVLAR